ncbi:hypothetical protein GCM10011504_41190 [Siccirubricoccus deserti]|nr:hypothetical protein GCM10011504_41190 [Siccirubricoccus deserti]
MGDVWHTTAAIRQQQGEARLPDQRMQDLGPVFPEGRRVVHGANLPEAPHPLQYPGTLDSPALGSATLEASGD